MKSTYFPSVKPNVERENVLRVSREGPGELEHEMALMEERALAGGPSNALTRRVFFFFFLKAQLKA